MDILVYKKVIDYIADFSLRVCVSYVLELFIQLWIERIPQVLNVGLLQCVIRYHTLSIDCILCEYVCIYIEKHHVPA